MKFYLCKFLFLYLRLLLVFAVKESVSKQSLLYVRYASVCWRVIETTLESTFISSKRTQRSVRNVRVVYSFLGITFMNDTAYQGRERRRSVCHCTVWPIGLAQPSGLDVCSAHRRH